MRFLPGNAQHIGSRHSQQDSFGFGDPDDAAFLAHGGFLAVVCDGMGGMEYGDAASRTAVRAFLEAYRGKTAEEKIPAALERSVHEANHQVVALAHRLGLAEGIGTTLAAAVLHEHSLYFISVGDSGLFLASGGELRMINHPHVFANMLDAAAARGAMSIEDALSHPERESLTSFIGAEVLEEIDLSFDPLPLVEGDTILLASDGLFKTLAQEEIAACADGHPQSWPEILVDRTLAKKREFQDNVTVLSVTLAEEETAGAAALPRTVAMAHPAPAAEIPPETFPKPAVDWSAPEVVKTPEKAPRRSSRTGLWIATLVLFLAAAAAGWWYARRAALHPAPNPASNRSIPSIPLPTGDMKGPPQ